jgi:hypothetical protein
LSSPIGEGRGRAVRRIDQKSLETNKPEMKVPLLPMWDVRRQPWARRRKRARRRSCCPLCRPPLAEEIKFLGGLTVELCGCSVALIN